MSGPLVAGGVVLLLDGVDLIVALLLPVLRLLNLILLLDCLL